MPFPLSDTQIRLSNVSTCLTATAKTLQIMSDSLKDPILVAIANTTQSLLGCAQTIKQNRTSCCHLLEQTHELLDAIILLHLKSDTGSDFTPNVLKHLVNFTETLQKINTFVEAQQNGSKLRKFFHQGEMSTLLKDCKAGLEQELEFFQIKTLGLITDIARMQQYAQERHQEVLDMIEALRDGTSLDQQSFLYSSSYTSSNSISLMLPSEPQIFHGRESELAEILQQFSQENPRIAILGAGGMGKTTLARAILHHTDIIARFGEHRVFVACDGVASTGDLAGLIAAHLGLKPGGDSIQWVIQHFSRCNPYLLILDNFETVWEPVQLRKEIEGLLCLLTDINHLALIITMRGAERPGKVRWTRPFLLPLNPLAHTAAQQLFLDITDDRDDTADIDKVLALTDNVPLAITLLAHLVDSEGCTVILSRWETEKTSLISDGHDKRSNLDLSISLSLSSPRIASEPQAQKLLSLLSILPEGLSDVELVQSKLSIVDVHRCKTALIRTSLAYIDEHRRLRALTPIREYMQKAFPPEQDMIHPLLGYFHALLEL
ncbi:P-loop containing nucleoside triphosphate hydrolase protein, partial [Mycena polygramma]